MYSFRQRSDTRVVDEPLYGHYLRVSNAKHPDRDSVLAHMNLDGNAVMDQLLADDCDRPVLFLKQMAHHLDQLDRAFLARTDNIFLIRGKSRQGVQPLPLGHPAGKGAGMTDCRR